MRPAEGVLPLDEKTRMIETAQAAGALVSMRTMPDGTEYPAELVGNDGASDLAVLKIVGTKPFPFVKFGDSRHARVGDWVIAIGNPFGLGGSVSAGIVSARGRNIESGPYDNYIQTDAAINKGNSGGPLFNMNGEVIGINTAILSPTGGSVGIGFAVPSNNASQVIDQLREFGEVRRGWLGVRIQNVDDATAEALADELRLGAGDLYGAISERLRVKHGLSIRILPVDVLPDVLRRRGERQDQRERLAVLLSSALFMAGALPL